MKGKNIMIQSLLWLCALCVSFVTGCIHDGIDAALTVDSKIVSVDARANYVSYTVTANTDWTIASNEDWCTPNVEGGIGTTNIYLSIEANDSSIKREAILSLVCGGKTTTVTVMQGALAAEMAVAPGEIEIDYTSQNALIAVMSNVVWTVSTDGSDWITNTTASGDNNGLITVECKENTTYATRSAVVIVSNSDKTLVEQVTITQLSSGLPTLALAQEALSFGNLTDTQSVALSSNIDASDIAVSSDFSWCTPSVNTTTGCVDVKVDQNSTSLSRSAIVTVKGVVDGESVSAQIAVSQAGVGYPVLYLINSSYSLGQAEQSDVIVRYTSENVTDVTISSYDSFITVYDTNDTFSLSENKSAESRVGTIALMATNASGNESYYYITVTQAGTGTPDIQTTPSSITLSAYAGSASFYAVVNNPSVKYVGATSSNSWLKSISQSGTSDDNRSFTYSYDANTSDAARTGYISLEYTVGDQHVFKTIQVTQNGLGAPAISTLEKVYLLTDQTTYTQSLWMVDGDDTNVTYEYYVSSNDSYATGNSSTTNSPATEWLSASIDSSKKELTLTLSKNTASESRSGIVTVIATRDNAQTIVNIDVTQAGHLSAGISGLDQEIYVDSKGITAIPYYFSALNDSEITVVAVSNTAMVTTPAATNILSKQMDLTVSSYDGADGAFRECIITLSANNGNSVVEYYDILVRQYEPDAAMADVPELLEIEYDDTSDKTVTIDLYNGAIIKESKVVESTATWLKVTDSGDVITYTALAYDGVDGDTRTATISVTVENTNANTATYFITVVQYAPRATTLSVTEGVSVYAVDTAVEIPFTVAGDGTIAVTPTRSTDTDSLWVTVPSATSLTSGTGSFSFTFAANTDSGSRSAIVYISAKGDDETVVTKQVTITQLGTGDAMIELPSSIAVGYAGITDEVVTPGLNSTTTIKDVSNGTSSWLTASKNSDTSIKYTASDYDGSEGDVRYATITVVSTDSQTGQEATSYITVSQASPIAPAISVQSSITVNAYGATSADNASKTLYYVATGDLVPGATALTVEAVESPSASIIDNIDYSQSGEIALALDPNTSTDTRTTTLKITVTGQYYEPAISYVEIVQAGVGAPAVDFAQDVINYTYTGTSASVTVTPTMSDPSAVNLTGASTKDTWIHVTYTSGNTFSYTVDAYDGEEGESRIGTIVVNAANGSENLNYSLAIIQSAPVAPVLTLSHSSVELASAKASTNVLPMTYTLTGDLSDPTTPTALTVAATETADWLTVNTATSGTITFTTDSENTSTTPRSATVELRVNGAAYYLGQDYVTYVTVTQLGLPSASATFSQDTFAYDFNAVTADVNVIPTLSASALISSVTPSDSSIAITTQPNGSAIALANPVNSFAFTVGEYDGSVGETRTGYITVTVSSYDENNNVINGTSVSYTLTVTQSAPLMPTLDLSTTGVVFNYTSSGLVENVTYKVTGDEITSTSAYDIDAALVDSSVTWLSATEGLNNTIVLTTHDENASATSRTAEVAVTVKGAHATEVVKYITVTQVGSGSPTANFSQTDFSYDYQAVTTSVDVTPTLSLLAKIKSVVSTDTAAVTIGTFAVGDTDFDFTVGEYDGSAGASRTTYINVKIANYDSNDNEISGTEVSYTLSVTQSAPSAPTLDLTTASVVFNTTAADSKTVTFTASGDGLSSVTAELVTAGDTWLTPTSNYGTSNTITLAVVENTSATSRTTDVKVTATGKNGSTVKYISVTQVGAGSPTASFVQSDFSYDYKGTDNVTVTPTLSGLAQIKNVTATDTAITFNSFSGPANAFTFDVAEYNGAAGTSRTMYITVVVDNYTSGTAAGTEVSYTLSVTQTAPNATTITAPASVTADAPVGSTVSFDVTTTGVNDTTSGAITVAATVDGTVVTNYLVSGDTVTFTLSANTTNASRSVIIPVTATGANSTVATAYVEVIQNGADAPTATFATTSFTATSVGYTDSTVTPTAFTPAATATITNVTTSDSAMITNIDYSATSSFDYDVESYDGSAGANRTGYLYVEVTDSATKLMTVYTLSVTQSAPKVTTLSATPTVYAYATDTSVTIAYTAVGDNVKVTGTNSGSDATFTSAISGTATYSLAANTGVSSRSFQIALTADGDYYQDATQYVTIVQYGTGGKLITVDSAVTATSSGAVTDSVTMTADSTVADADIKVSTTATWLNNVTYSSGSLSYTTTAYDGAEGAYRYGSIKIVATASTGAVETTEVVVSQPSPAETTLNVSTNLSASADSQSYTIDCTVAGDNVTVTPTWDTQDFSSVSFDSSTNKLTFVTTENALDVAVNKQIKLVADGDYYKNAEAYINVSQSAQGVPTATFDPSTIYYTAAGSGASVTVAPTLSSNAEITAIDAGGSSWVTGTSYTASDVSFTVAANPNTTARQQTITVTVADKTTTTKTATYSLSIYQFGMETVRFTITPTQQTVDALTSTATYQLGKDNVDLKDMNVTATANTSNITNLQSSYDSSTGVLTMTFDENTTSTTDLTDTFSVVATATNFLDSAASTITLTQSGIVMTTDTGGNSSIAAVTSRTVTTDASGATSDNSTSPVAEIVVGSNYASGFTQEYSLAGTDYDSKYFSESGTLAKTTSAYTTTRYVTFDVDAYAAAGELDATNPKTLTVTFNVVSKVDGAQVGSTSTIGITFNVPSAATYYATELASAALEVTAATIAYANGTGDKTVTIEAVQNASLNKIPAAYYSTSAIAGSFNGGTASSNLSYNSGVVTYDGAYTGAETTISSTLILSMSVLGKVVTGSAAVSVTDPKKWNKTVTVCTRTTWTSGNTYNCENEIDNFLTSSYGSDYFTLDFIDKKFEIPNSSLSYTLAETNFYDDSSNTATIAASTTGNSYRDFGLRFIVADATIVSKVEIKSYDSAVYGYGTGYNDPKGTPSVDVVADTNNTTYKAYAYVAAVDGTLGDYTIAITYTDNTTYYLTVDTYSASSYMPSSYLK